MFDKNRRPDKCDAKQDSVTTSKQDEELTQKPTNKQEVYVHIFIILFSSKSL